jgi:hypothetical protein
LPERLNSDKTEPMARGSETPMAEEAERVRDADWRRKTYVAIMKGSGEVIVPIALAATVLATNLVVRNGPIVSLVGGLITYLVARWVVRTFFSH